MTYCTTLNRIRSNRLCESGWKRLLRTLGKTKADDEPLPMTTILDSNGLDDTLWCFRTAPEFERLHRHYAVWCARQVQHLMTDHRSLAALDVAERYADGLATEAELADAWDAAWDVARGAAWSARDTCAVWATRDAWAAGVSAAWAVTGAAEWAAATAREAVWSARRYQVDMLRRICEAPSMDEAVAILK
jgi:hypothetical protein